MSRHLVAAQELLPDRVEAAVLDVGVDAGGVAVPDVDHHARERGARAPGDACDREAQREGDALTDRAVARVGADVGAFEALVDEVGTLGLLGAHDARGHVGGGRCG
jgi:hypothetical protein